VEFSFLLSGLPEALDKRSQLPWKIEERKRLFELGQLMGHPVELEDENFKVYACEFLFDGRFSVEQVAQIMKEEIEYRRTGEKKIKMRKLPVWKPVVMTVNCHLKKIPGRTEE
jgi:hypothetical protein